jgi:Arc/MetJ-type ribon-helix-helix transcriptional regulator
MSLQVPADVESSVRAFVANGRFADESDVLRKAIAALEREELDVAAIQEGVDDMEAERYRPWEEVKAELDAKYGFGKS